MFCKNNIKIYYPCPTTFSPASQRPSKLSESPGTFHYIACVRVFAKEYL